MYGNICFDFGNKSRCCNLYVFKIGYLIHVVSMCSYLVDVCGWVGLVSNE